MKKVLGLLLVVVVCNVVVTLAFAADQVELRFAWWGSQNRHDRTIKVIEMFQQEHPNINIIYEFAGGRDYWTKMSTQAVGGNLPDIMQHDYARIIEWINKGLLLPLDDFVKTGVLDFTNVSDQALAGGRLNGKLYGVNVGNNSQCFVLDVEAFEKAGIALPSQNWTWTDFEKIVLQLHEKLGTWAMGPGLSQDQLWKSLYLSLGQWVYAPDEKSLGYTDDQSLIDYFKMILRLQEAGAIPTREEELAEFAQAGVEKLPIVTGKAAMEVAWSNQLVALWKAAGDNRRFVLTHVPRAHADGPAGNYLKPSQFLSVTSQSKHPQEAAMFINYFTNSLEANKVLLAERGVPISSVVSNGLRELLTPSQLEIFTYLVRVEQDGSPLPPPDASKHADIMNNVYWPEFVDPILLQQIPVEEGVKRFYDLVQEILAGE